MKEQLVSFETAKLAKEKGFDWETIHIYDLSQKPPILNLYGEVSEDYELYAPTQSLLQKWLREVHRIYVYIKPIHNLDINGLMLDNWEICIEDFMGRKSLEESIYIHGYEEALEVGLQETLKLIK